MISRRNKRTYGKRHRRRGATKQVAITRVSDVADVEAIKNKQPLQKQTVVVASQTRAKANAQKVTRGCSSCGKRRK